MTGGAPIAVFAYKRPVHTRRLLESLRNNPEAAHSPIHIYCDGARGDADLADVQETRRVARAEAPAHASLVERANNLGLADSIIAGVSELCAAHGAVIVLEDDLVLSPVALDYFNRALERFHGDERVMHVSGYMYPVQERLPETFFYREATCWGWATWARAWRRFEPDAAQIRRAIRERSQERHFDAEGSYNFCRLLDEQITGRVNSWAIRWYGSLWLNGGLALHPGRSLVHNFGHDGSGENGHITDEFEVQLRTAPIRAFPEKAEECEAALRALVEFRRRATRPDPRRLLRRLWRRLSG